MTVQCKYGNMKFEISSSKLNPITSFKTSLSQIADNNSSTEDSTQTNQRGTDLQEFTLSCDYVAGLGVDIEDEYSKWKDLVTTYEYIYINGKKATPKVQLREVELSDVTFDYKGRMVMATLEFSFKEYDKSTTSVIGTSAFGTATKSSSSSSKSATTKTTSSTKKATTKTITKGTYVKPTGKKYATGETIPSWVKKQYHKVHQIKDTKILLGYPDGIRSWIYKSECTIK